MIRDRLKNAAKKLALKAFGMERDAEARTTRKTTGTAGSYDASKIPKLVDGDGDTPGPNSRDLIGRTFLAASVIGGDDVVVVDVRPPQEWIAGTLPRAHLLPNRQLLDRPEILPADKTTVIALYDATDEQAARTVAAALREQGYRALALVGGWAEWVEQDEPQEIPPVVEGAAHQLGDPVELVDGRRGTVQAVLPGPSYDVLFSFEDDTVERGVPGSKLRD